MKKRTQAARRQEPRTVNRQLLRRWTVALLLAALTGLAGLGVWTVSDVVDGREFPIRSVRVEGSFRHVSAEQVSRIVAPYAAAGFFETDVSAAKQALEALPWVDAAAVRRVWPDVLHVTLVEQHPAAHWGSDSLVNPRGEVFTPVRGVDAEHELPLLEGPRQTAPQVLGFYREVRALLTPLGLHAERLRMDVRRAWQLQLSNGITVTLGREQTMRRLQRFIRFYPKVVARRSAEIEEVDLRYPNGFAVRWSAPALNASRLPTAQETGDNV